MPRRSAQDVCDQRQVSRDDTSPVPGERKWPLSVRSEVRMRHCSSSWVHSHAASFQRASRLRAQSCGSGRDPHAGRRARAGRSRPRWRTARTSASRRARPPTSSGSWGRPRTVRPSGSPDRKSPTRSAPCPANAPEHRRPLRNGDNDHPSACSGTSAPMNSQMVGSTSTDSVMELTTEPRPAIGRRRGGRPRSGARGSSRPSSRASPAASGHRPSRRGRWSR